MKRTKHGFTLVELLVVISIIGILMGLLIPAVNAARETARRGQCGTQLKNFGLAAVQYENSKGVLPPWVDNFGYFAGGTDPSDLGNYMGTVPAHIKVGGWGVSLLPWLDAQPTYEHWTQDRYPVLNDGSGDLESSGGLSGDKFHELAAPNLAIFQCPSNPVSEGSHGKNSYVTNNGMSHIYTTSGHSAASPGTQVISILGSQSKSNGCFTARYRGVNTSSTPPSLLPVAPAPRLDDLKDGQSFTMLVSENVQAAPWHRPGFLNAEDLGGANVVVLNNKSELVSSTQLEY
jgi:prepilin-type N-terminal cleavage/methylation domain-containing protein